VIAGHRSGRGDSLEELVRCAGWDDTRVGVMWWLAAVVVVIIIAVHLGHNVNNAHIEKANHYEWDCECYRCVYIVERHDDVAHLFPWVAYPLAFKVCGTCCPNGKVVG